MGLGHVKRGGTERPSGVVERSPVPRVTPGTKVRTKKRHAGDLTGRCLVSVYVEERVKVTVDCI